MDVMRAIEDLAHRHWEPRYHDVIDWLDRVPPPAEYRLRALEKVHLLHALAIGSGDLFWSAVWIWAWAFRRGARLPSNEDLAYLVKAMAAAQARREATTVKAVEAAEVLGCSTVHVRRLIKAGRLQASWIATKPGRWEVDNASVYAYAAAANKA